MIRSPGFGGSGDEPSFRQGGGEITVYVSTRMLLLCGVAAPIVLVAFVTWAVAVTPNYSHISHTISQLAAQGRPHPWIMSTGFVVFGLLMDGFARGLSRTLKNGAGKVGTSIGLLVFGTSVLISGFFQDYNENPSVPPNLEGYLHSLFANIAVQGLIGAMFFFARTVYDCPEWHGMVRFTITIAALIVLEELTFTLISPGVQGIAQRALYATTLLWIAPVALRALRTS